MRAARNARTCKRRAPPAFAPVILLVPLVMLFLPGVSCLVLPPLVPPHKCAGPDPYKHPLRRGCEQRVGNLFGEEPPQKLNKDTPDRKTVRAANTKQQETLSAL